ncbi:MAG: hypothetical protein ABS938_00800 [Psychrobacillus psychrodurans]
MKKLLFLAPLALSLYACGDVSDIVTTKKEEATNTVSENKATEKKVSIAEETEWAVDERLQEPTEDTTCYMCSMKVYTRESEQGVFSAQAIRENGEIVFYDDIGCLLNDEYVYNVVNEKFVRDYHTLKWISTDEAYAVKTDLKSPMNWGYIFFKFEEDANAYIDEHEHSAIATLDEIQIQAIERHKKKKMNSTDHTHGQHEHINTENSMTDESNQNTPQYKSHE